MKSIFTSCKIGKLEVRNRFIMSPINLSYCPGGYINEKVVEFYRARAKGGVGLINVGAVGIDPERVNTVGVIQLYDDTFIPGIKMLADAVKAEGAGIFLQIWHPGAYARSKEFSGIQAVAPSALLSNFTREMPRELSIDEIKQIIGYFGKAAARAKHAGCDGVEIVASAGYLIAQFLSPATNKRTDCYGGNLTSRMRFLLEVVEAVRSETGDDFPIMVRLAGNEFIKGGNGSDEAVEIAQTLERAGVNAIDVTGGWHETAVPQVTMDVPLGAYCYLARKVKKGVGIPVVACNRINFEVAEKIIDHGYADFVGIGRGFVAEPELVNKAQRGDCDLIRPCIGCNQGCMDNIFKEKPLDCLANPEAGIEFKLHGQSDECNPNPSLKPEKVLIIGAGAAGMEYARVAAEKGHQVTVREQKMEPGGQLSLAGSPPGRHDFLYLKDYLFNSCKKLEVVFEFGRGVTAEEIIKDMEAKWFDRVVLATGARPVVPKIPVEDGASVVQAWEVLDGCGKVGRNVVIIGGGAVGVETALKISEEGTLDNDTLRFLILYKAETLESIYEMLTSGDKKVTIVEMMETIGRDIGPSTRWIMLKGLKKFGIEQITSAKVLEIKKSGVLVENTDGEQSFIQADTIVLAIGSQSLNSLEKELEGRIQNLDVIGDANRPRKVSDSIKEAYETALRLGVAT